MVTPQKAALMRRNEVEREVQISRSTLYAKLNKQDKGYDPDFPVPIRVSATAVRWIREEVEDFIASRARIRDSRQGKNEDIDNGTASGVWPEGITTKRGAITAKDAFANASNSEVAS